MISLHRSYFLNTSISGSSSLFSYKLKKLPLASVKATALGPNRDRNGSILIENNNTLKEIRDGSSSVADVDSNPTVASKGRDVTSPPPKIRLSPLGLSLLLVGVLCCEILTITKGLPSLRKREMLITCVVFFLQLLFLKSSR